MNWNWIGIELLNMDRNWNWIGIELFNDDQNWSWNWKSKIGTDPSLLRCQRLIYPKAADLGHILLLNTNRKSYPGRPKPPSHLTLSDFEMSKLRCWIWSKMDTCIVRYMCTVWELTQISIDLVSSREFLIQVCWKLPMSSQLQLSSRAPRSLDLLFFSPGFMGCMPPDMYWESADHVLWERSVMMVRLELNINRSSGCCSLGFKSLKYSGVIDIVQRILGQGSKF